MSQKAPPSSAPITPEQAEAVLKKDVANIIAKARDGRPLSSAQRASILSLAGGGGGAVPVNGIARNKAELVRVLGIARGTFGKWEKLDGAPPPNSDNTHSVPRWLDFIRARGLKDTGGGEGSGPQDLKDRRLLAQCLKLEAELDILRGDWLPRAVVERFLSGVFVAVRAKITNSRLPADEQNEILADLKALRDADPDALAGTAEPAADV